MSWWQGFCYALGQLTCVLTKPKELSLKALHHSLWFYPLLGVIIGAILVLTLQILAFSYAPRQHLHTLFAFLLLFLWILLTGGLHLGQLSRCVDGWVVKQAQLRPPLAPAGVLALLLVLLGKLSALSVLLKQPTDLGVNLMLLFVPMAARMSQLSLFASLPYIGNNPLEQQQKQGASSFVVIVSLFWVLMLASLLLQRQVFKLFGFACAWGILSYLMLKQRLGGSNHDSLGAHLEIQETLMLLVLALEA